MQKRFVDNWAFPFLKYRLEVKTMPDLLEQLKIDTINELLRSMSNEEFLKGLTTEQRIKGLSPAEVLVAMSPQDRKVLIQLLKDNDPSVKPDYVQQLLCR